MNLLAIRHVKSEHLGIIEDFLMEKNIRFRYLDVAEEKPDEKLIEKSDILVVLGGYMGVYEAEKYKFLKTSFEIVERFLEKNKKILGICLGSQILAHVLGEKVFPGGKKEIGFYPIFKVGDNELFSDFPNKFIAFHWHGDTFYLPKGAKRIFSSELYENQGFVYQKAVGLQFHIEVNKDMVFDWAKNSEDELKEAGVDPEDWERVGDKVFSDMKLLCFNFLEKFINL